MLRMRKESRAWSEVRGELANTKSRLLVVENIVHAGSSSMDGTDGNAPIEKRNHVLVRESPSCHREKLAIGMMYSTTVG